MNLHNRNKLSTCSRPARVALAGFGVALLLGLAGCKSAEKKDDPLFGVKPPTVNPVPPTTGAQSRAPVPPIPGNTSAASTAALAGLPGGRSLAINDSRSPISAGSTPNVSTVPNVQPIPRDTPTVRGLLTTGSWTQPLPAITPNLPPAPANNPVDSQFAPLQARGASAQFVETVPEGVHLRVLVPHRANPGAVRIYEATARDTAAAVQGVIQQIDQQR